MRLFLPVLLFLPLMEIAVMVMVGQEIGVAGVLLWLVLDGIAGVWLMRWQGAGTVRRVQAALRRGEVPVHDALDGFAFALAGFLLLLPGFISDIAALLLLLPPVRHLVRRRFGGRQSEGFARAKSGRGAQGPIIDAEEWVVEDEEDAARNLNGRRRLEERKRPSERDFRS